MFPFLVDFFFFLLKFLKKSQIWINMHKSDVFWKLGFLSFKKLVLTRYGTPEIIFWRCWFFYPNPTGSISHMFAWFDSYRPSQHFFSYIGFVFLGWTSSKPILIWLAEEHNAVPRVGLEPATLNIVRILKLTSLIKLLSNLLSFKKWK